MESEEFIIEVERFADELKPKQQRTFALACVAELEPWVALCEPPKEFFTEWQKAVNTLREAVADGSTPPDLEAYCDQIDEMPSLFPEDSDPDVHAFCTITSHALYCATGVLGGLIELHTPLQATLQAAKCIADQEKREGIQTNLEGLFKELRAAK